MLIFFEKKNNKNYTKIFLHSLDNFWAKEKLRLEKRENWKTLKNLPNTTVLPWRYFMVKNVLHREMKGIANKLRMNFQILLLRASRRKKIVWAARRRLCVHSTTDGGMKLSERKYRAEESEGRRIKRASEQRREASLSIFINFHLPFSWLCRHWRNGKERKNQSCHVIVLVINFPLKLRFTLRYVCVSRKNHSTRHRTRWTRRFT